MNEHFNIVSLIGFEPADLKRFKEIALPATGQIKNAFLIALAHERAAIRRSNAAERIEYRKIDPDGKLISAILQNGKRLDDNTPVPGAMAPDTINSYRDPAERALQEKFIASITPPSGAKPKESPARELPPGVIDIASVRKKKNPPPQADAASLIFGGSGARGAIDDGEIMSFYLQLEKQAQELALEKMAPKVALAFKIIQHEADLFDGDREAAERAISFVLAEKVLRQEFQTASPKESLTYRLILGPAVAELAEQVESFERAPGFLDSPGCMRETKALALLKTYNLLASEFRFRSGLAGKNNAERASLLDLCNGLIGTASGRREHAALWADIGREAERVKELVKSDLFTPAELKHG